MDNPTEKPRIAVGGSAVNPVTMGHRNLVSFVAMTCDYEKVIFQVSGLRKDKKHLLPLEHRWAMAQLLFDPDDEHIVLEVESGETRPTITVLREMQAKYPDHEIVWYCGADHFLKSDRYGGGCELQTWDDGDELMAKWSFLIIPREGIEWSDLILPKHYEVLHAKMPIVSSTAVRKLALQKKRLWPLVGHKVEKYFYKHGLDKLIVQ